MQTTTKTRTYAIDPAHSEVLFTVRHLMIAKVRGHFTGVHGSVTLGADDVPAAVKASIDANTVTTREEKRDGHLRSADFLDVANFPEITFTSTSITGSGPAFTIVGDLTIHGASKSVTLDAVVGGHTPIHGATTAWPIAQRRASSAARSASASTRRLKPAG